MTRMLFSMIIGYIIAFLFPSIEIGSNECSYLIGCFGAFIIISLFEGNINAVYILEFCKSRIISKEKIQSVRSFINIVRDFISLKMHNMRLCVQVYI